jgi:antirestriction protein ArdC
MPSQNEIRERITNQIIEALESGKLAPWRMPWRNDPNAGAPTNVVSHRCYRGINPLILQLHSIRFGFQSRWWGTFKQWKELGGSVIRRPQSVPSGQFGAGIIFWSKVTKVEENRHGEEEEKDIFFLRQYTVFNIDQVEGDHLNHLRVGHTITNANPVDTYEAADRAIAATGADIKYGGNRAYYNRKQDYIQVPLREQFSAGEYYETILHELIHWSEHPNRLDWHQAERPYAVGELIAEMGSCFLASELGLPNAETLPNHASYLESWLKEMRSDHRYIFQAATQASKAADYILSFSRVEQPEEVAV